MSILLKILENLKLGFEIFQHLFFRNRENILFLIPKFFAG